MDTTRTSSGGIDSIRSAISSTMSAMRRSPAVIAGVAGGVAVAAGIAGRMLRNRVVKQPAGFMPVGSCS